MKHYTIYQTTNLVNGKIYIGMHETDNPNDDYLGSGKRLKRSIRYYGKENFQKKILFDFDNREQMINKEIELVTEEFINRKDTYNIALGGEGSWKKNISKEKLILGAKRGGLSLQKKRKEDPALNEKILNNLKLGPKFSTPPSFKGKTHSIETKLKMSKSKNQKENNSQFGTCWITNEKENIKIQKGNLIPEGWRLGRKMNLKK